MAKKNILFKPYRKGDEHQAHWFDHDLVNLFSKSIRFWEKYFRYSTVGLENIPKKGGALLANNHGLVMFDVFLLARKLLAMNRPPRALSEHSTWKFPIIREVLLNMGIVDGNPKTAIRLLRQGDLVIVFPGGAKEGMKTSSERYKLYWDDHYGFIKVAIAAGVPIIPCFSAGIDHTYHIFASGYRLSKRLFGTFIPMPLFMGLGLMPLPVKITHHIGKPIYMDVPAQAYRDPKTVKRLHRKVASAMTDLKIQALENYKPIALS